ncbi:unnamed protein product [Adineta ricciae]|uniref:EGF-like domain-containing protein n=1 Tax=Adineta ricciae TaxID=249248 RepID=A0A815IG88_ADIRI|nr:unnamed protein product [Adineta ricciae]
MVEWKLRSKFSKQEFDFSRKVCVKCALVRFELFGDWDSALDNHAGRFIDCENGAQCIQERSTWPKTSMCVCPSCYYGARCQFSSDGFGLTLDGILGYRIQLHVSIYGQSLIVNVSLAFTSIITIAGMINGILMTVTFKSKKLRQNGCEMYLL